MSPVKWKDSKKEISEEEEKVFVVPPLTFHWNGYKAEVDERAGEVVAVTPPLRREILPGLMQQGEEKPIRGLSERFSRIETPKDVSKFAAEYGLLGVAKEPGGSSAKYFPDSPPNYTETTREPLSLWFEHAELMRRLLDIHRILQRGKRDSFYEAEDHLLDVLRFKKRHNIVEHVTQENGKITHEVKTQAAPLRETVWAEDGRLTGNVLDEEIPPLEAGALILASLTGRMLQGGIHVEYERVVEARDTPLGYRISEALYTNSPLAAAYYDLWELITEGRGVVTCRFCNRVIERRLQEGPGRDRKYCNGACRVADHRRRKKEREVPENRERS